MKPRSWLVPLLLVSLATSVIFWLWPSPHETSAVAINQRPTDPNPASLLTKPIPLPAAGVTLTPQFVGIASSRPDHEFGPKIAEALKKLKSGQGTVSEPVAPLDPRTIDESLLPKAPQLSAEQRAALTKLRWGLAKDLRYRGDGDNATVRSLASVALAAPLDPKNPAAEAPEKMAARFISENRGLFLLAQPETELTVHRSDDDGLGGKVVRFTQNYKGIEVWPAQMTANITKHGYLTVITGAYSPTPEGLSVTPSLTATDALEKAALKIGADSAASVEVHSAPQLKIYTEKGRAPELSYEVVLESSGKHERIFVSAQTGDVLLSYSEICSAATTGSGVDVLGVTRSLNVYSDGSPARYYLLDTSKPMFNASTGTGQIIMINRASNPINYSFSASQFSGYDPEGVSAAYNLGKVYDFYKGSLARNSYDANGASIVANIRVPEADGSILKNAYWNGTAMFFGLGDRYTASSDVIAHEFTHAVVSKSAGLVYNSESGAINESFADIFGESFENYLTGSNDWLIGSQLRTYFPALGGALRSMSNPILAEQPATMSSYDYTTEDNGGVHINSGIPNHAFYLLAAGLPSGGIGITQARNIFYRALTTKLNSKSDFHDLRTACVLSAEELHGTGSTQVGKVREAFDYVQIYERTSLPPPSNLTPPAGADAYLVTYESTNGSYYLGRREAALGDGSAITNISGYAMDTNSRPTITADGSIAGHVTAAHNLAITATNGSGSTFVDFGGAANAFSISADGNFLAIIARDTSTGLAEPRIFYSNLTTSVTEVIDLYLPVADGPNTISITSVDEVDLSPDGQYALFDGLAETQLPGGGKISSWTIFLVDLKSKAVTALTPPETGSIIGNPSFSRTSTQRIAFELVNTSSYIIAYDAARSQIAAVRAYANAQTNFAYPRYSAADNFIVFTEDFFFSSAFPTEARVARINLLSDLVTPSTSPTTLIKDFAVHGLSYRRGTFAGAPVISVSTTTPTVVGGTSGAFRISRISGDQSIQVAVSFKATGTAQPSVDYQKVTPSVTLAAGQSFKDVPVASLLIPGSSSKSLTLTVDPLYHYVVSNPGQSATITLTAPAANYNYWATGNSTGLPAADDDADGIANLIEYALGTNPKTATANYLTIETATGGLLTFAQLRIARALNREGLSYTLQRSSDGINWSAAGTAVVTDTATALVLRDSLALEVGQARYLRLQFTETTSSHTATSAVRTWVSVALGQLSQTYNGQPKTVSVTTVPANTPTVLTYNGNATAPTAAGSYTVSATVNSSTMIGGASDTLVIAKASQTIAFTALADRLYTDAVQSLSATASSGLPVGFSLVSGTATVNGSQLTLTGIGSVTVRATQSGDANYQPAPTVDRTFKVNTSFEWWRRDKFTLQELANNTVSGANALPTQDGLSNLVKYALGLAPKENATTGLPSLSLDSNRWVYTYTRPVDRLDLTYVVEVSTDLTNWTAVNVTHELVSTVNDLQTWRGIYALGSSERIFFRLKVSRQ